MSVPPVIPPHSCGCLSGITAKQAAMLELAGSLEAIIWLIVQAKMAHELGDEADAAVVERLEKTQLAITRMREWCREHGWNR